MGACCGYLRGGRTGLWIMSAHTRPFDFLPLWDRSTTGLPAAYGISVGAARI
jgi:hypothetical protein